MQKKLSHEDIDNIVDEHTQDVKPSQQKDGIEGLKEKLAKASMEAVNGGK